MFIPLTPLRCLARAVELYGSKVGVVSGDRRFTYAAFAERCYRLGSALQSAGLQPGDRVAFLSFNTHQLLEGYFGVPHGGGIVMPLNVRLTPVELTAILNHSGARFLFYEDDFAAAIPLFRESCPALTACWPLDDAYEDLLARGTPAAGDISAIDELSIAEVFYTSGSTGSPKGVALSHRTLHLHALSVALALHQEDTGVELHTIPLFHANGWGRPQATTLVGARHVMVRRFDPATVFRLIETERATSMSLVPAMAGALLNAPDLASRDFSSLLEIHLGGAASSPELIARMEQAFGCPCMSGYGLTETSPVAASARPKATVTYAGEADRLQHLSSAGWPLPGVSIRVVDAELQDVARNNSDIGEVIISGDHLMDGYFHEPETTAAVMSGNWFHTGDMGIWDEENFIRIVDRKKDIIISGGENISSIEVEHAIAAHPDILECAVVSAPDEKWGEIPVAIVVTRRNESITAEMLCEFLMKRLARFKIPRKFEFTDEPLPRTGTGKVLKRELRDRYWLGKQERVQG